MAKKKVYISSTFADLEAHRSTLKQALERAQFDVESMERYPAFDARPLDKCLADVAKCDHYVLVIAHRYGFVPDGSTYPKSITQLEYEHARATGRHILPFVVDEQFVWNPAFVDRDELARRLAAFRTAVQHNHVRATFTTPDSLASAVLQALRAERPGPPLVVLPINAMGMNVVRGVEDNNEPNGSFSVHLALQMAPGEQPVDLLGFSALYFVDGCPALQRQPELEFGGQVARLMSNWHSLAQPVRLPDAGISLQYRRALRPPLMTDTPEDCDYGDVKVEMTYRILGDEHATHADRFYRFEPGGVLVRIDAVRPVPRLNDEELQRCHAVGRITGEELQTLLAIDQADRYMGARSDVGQNFVRWPAMLRLLRMILEKPC